MAKLSRLDHMITWILLKYSDRELSVRELHQYAKETRGMDVSESSVRARLRDGVVSKKYVRTAPGWYAIDEVYADEARRALRLCPTGGSEPDATFKPWLADLLDSIGAPTGATLRGRMVKLAALMTA